MINILLNNIIASKCQELINDIFIFAPNAIFKFYSRVEIKNNYGYNIETVNIDDLEKFLKDKNISIIITKDLNGGITKNIINNSNYQVLTLRNHNITNVKYIKDLKDILIKLNPINYNVTNNNVTSEPEKIVTSIPTDVLNNYSFLKQKSLNVREKIYGLVNDKVDQIKNNEYNPAVNNVKYLILFATYCDSELRYKTIQNNLRYFDYANIDILFINTTGLPLNEKIRDICKVSKNIKCVEIENSVTSDFGKWIYGLETINYNNYDYIVFTNDSFIIHSSINHFFNLLCKSNVELYGYNDSSEIKKHYQSYLFALKKDAIPTFIQKYNAEKNTITCVMDVICKYEINMTDWFNNTECFLPIGNISIHKGKNIYYSNYSFYRILKDHHLLPFTKLKQINNNKNMLKIIFKEMDKKISEKVNEVVVDTTDNIETIDCNTFDISKD